VCGFVPCKNNGTCMSMHNKQDYQCHCLSGMVSKGSRSQGMLCVCLYFHIVLLFQASSMLWELFLCMFVALCYIYFPSLCSLKYFFCMVGSSYSSSFIYVSSSPYFYNFS
jgi:hypothetical protein